MKKVLILDFDDSFTHNLEELFHRLNYHVSCIHWRQAGEYVTHGHDLIVFGPGPGHPHEYQELKDIFTLLKSDEFKSQKVMGVCLGHQLLLQSFGLELKQLNEPLHGKSLVLDSLSKALGLSYLKGQFYNSWYVPTTSLPDGFEGHGLDDMTVFFSWKNWLGVQFHPESVGTSCPKELMEGLLSKLGV